MPIKSVTVTQKLKIRRDQKRIHAKEKIHKNDMCVLGQQTA